MPLEIKRGDTFSVSGPVSVQDGMGVPIDLTDWTAASQIRFIDTGTKVTLTVTWLNNFTALRLYSNTTLNWVEGNAEIDIQFTSPSGTRVSTKTEKMKILPDLTHV